MIVEYTLRKGTKPTPEQIEEIRAAAKSPIVFDDDCPPLTPERYEAMKKATEARNRHLEKRNA